MAENCDPVSGYGGEREKGVSSNRGIFDISDVECVDLRELVCLICSGK